MPTIYLVKREDGSWTGDSVKGLMDSRKPGTSWEVTFRRITPQRSSNQNRWYRGCILPMVAEFIGESEDATHEALLDKFSAYRAKGARDKRFGLKVKKRTRDMDTAQFTEYVEKVRDWAAQFLGLNIPDPVS